MTTPTRLGWPGDPEPDAAHRRLGWARPRPAAVSRETVLSDLPERGERADASARGPVETTVTPTSSAGSAGRDATTESLEEAVTAAAEAGDSAAASSHDEAAVGATHGVRVPDPAEAMTPLLPVDNDEAESAVRAVSERDHASTSPGGLGTSLWTTTTTSRSAGAVRQSPTTSVSRLLPRSLPSVPTPRWRESWLRTPGDGSSSRVGGSRAPQSPRVLTIANQKGGVGKTTTTVNIAAAMAQGGLRVLVIDLDPQGNASTALGIDHHADVPSVYDVLVEGMPLDDVVQECTSVPGLFCAPATIDLAGAEIELVSLVARESRLLRALRTGGSRSDDL